MCRSLEVIGAREIWEETDDTWHLDGTARMGEDPATSVVDADCRAWDVPNVSICDGSVFPTVGGVNPSLTIQAIACRTVDRIKALAVQAAARINAFEAPDIGVALRPPKSVRFATRRLPGTETKAADWPTARELLISPPRRVLL
jgi:hypothetical protein